MVGGMGLWDGWDCRVGGVECMKCGVGMCYLLYLGMILDYGVAVIKAIKIGKSSTLKYPTKYQHRIINNIPASIHNIT